MPAFVRKKLSKAKPTKYIAWDLETTNIIDNGILGMTDTPSLKYFTIYSEIMGIKYQCKVDSMVGLCDIFSKYLIDDYCDCKFVAHNSNRFDSFFLAKALITSDKYVIKPYLTNKKMLRGFRVLLSEFINDDGEYPKSAPSWEFLDSLSITGIEVTLYDFTKSFAPDYVKLKDNIDFSNESFNPDNVKHCEYAMMDSVGLYHAITNAEKIMIDTFNKSFNVTMGGSCIKLLQSYLPENVSIFDIPPKAKEIIDKYVKRGGYVYCPQVYKGKVWKYDVNQAYAAIMRDVDLPAGLCLRTVGNVDLTRLKTPYFACINATNEKNIIPFYIKKNDGKRDTAMFVDKEITETWLTDLEIKQLIIEGWKISTIELYRFTDSFRLKEYVDNLEKLRTTCMGGTKGAIGTMVKATGNHSFGKTLQEIGDKEYIFCKNKPNGYHHTIENLAGGEIAVLPNLYERGVKQRPKDYHKPQIGAWVTAGARMKLRRALLIAPEYALYADTDCVAFSIDVTDKLDVDDKRYGAWKLEENGEEMIIIDKKVYMNVESGKSKAKGISTKSMDVVNKQQTYEDWADGKEIPSQIRPQKANLVEFVAEKRQLFKNVKRTGSDRSKKKK